MWKFHKYLCNKHYMTARGYEVYLLSHSFAALTRERYFQHSKRNLVSPRDHVISSIALKSHALSVSLTHFDAISRSHADTSISHALTLFSKVTLPFKLSEVLMNSEFAPSLALNFG